jgi:hypothetical protein
MTHKKAARTRRALRFVSTAIDDLEVFQEPSPPSSSISNGRNNVRFAKLLKGKMKQQIVTITAEKLCLHRCVAKVKQSHYRPRQAHKFPGGWSSQILRQSAHECGKVVSPKHRLPLSSRNYSWYSFSLWAG